MSDIITSVRATNERRLKIVSLNTEAVVSLLSAPTYQFLRCFALPVPEGFAVESVAAVWDRCCIDVLISHPDFEPVPLGECPPRLPGLHQEVRVFGRIEGDGDLPVYREVKNER